MNAGINDLHGEDLGDFRDASNALPREARASALFAVLNTRNELAARRLDSSNDAQEFSLRWKQLLALNRSE
jgi:hypothetical protein